MSTKRTSGTSTNKQAGEENHKAYSRLHLPGPGAGDKDATNKHKRANKRGGAILIDGRFCPVLFLFPVFVSFRSSIGAVPGGGAFVRAFSFRFSPRCYRQAGRGGLCCFSLPVAFFVLCRISRPVVFLFSLTGAGAVFIHRHDFKSKSAVSYVSSTGAVFIIDWF